MQDIMHVLYAFVTLFWAKLWYQTQSRQLIVCVMALIGKELLADDAGAISVMLTEIRCAGAIENGAS